MYCQRYKRHKRLLTFVVVSGIDPYNLRGSHVEFQRIKMTPFC